MRLGFLACSLALLIAGSPPLLAQDESSERPNDRSESPRDTVYVMPRVLVVGAKERHDLIPASASILDAASLERAHVFTTNEALRKLPGLTVRDEEGFGMRPNVGIRGLNPTRSTKVTLLEDGIPLAYAPYGDNASYYHPPVERFETVELLKGAGQIPFGPQTIGGVINYLTPTPPVDLEGFVSAAGGSRDYALGRLRLGGRRMLLDVSRKEGDGARDNIHSRVHDLNFKTVVGTSRPVTVRANYFTELSAVTYSGLTQAEYETFGPRYNPFTNDEFESHRLGASATQNLTIGPAGLLTTNLYAFRFERDWWRQSSTTTDTQGGPGVAAARIAGSRIDPDTIASIQGRLREYTTWGIEPRGRFGYAAGGMRHELQAGIRAHFERQDREQRNGGSPTTRTGTLVEDNLRETRAYSAFLAHRTERDAWSVSPGIRFEYVRSSRTDRLPGGASGSDDLEAWVPSLGATWRAADEAVLFAGIHRGFAPPRTEDVIASVGTSTEVGPENSTNAEIGLRLGSTLGTHLHAAAFRNDFGRLIAVGSIAGGSTPLAEGAARFSGAELSGKWLHSSGLYLSGAYTWLPEADQRTPFRQVVGGAIVAGSTAGNRQPYAPEHSFAAAAGVDHRGFDAQIEAVHVGSQYADFANTEAPSADGQRGRIAAHTVWNATLGYAFGHNGPSAFVAVKNLGNQVTIVDRTRGIQSGIPRLVQAGVKYAFTIGR